MSTSVVMTLAITTIILLSIAIFPSAFWARYLPHASLLPLLAIMLSYQFKQRGMPLVQFYLALNLYLIASIHFPYIQSSNVRARSKLAAVASSKKKPEVFFEAFSPSHIRLDQFGIEYVPVAQKGECNHGFSLEKLGYGALLCP